MMPSKKGRGARRAFTADNGQFIVQRKIYENKWGEGDVFENDFAFDDGGKGTRIDMINNPRLTAEEEEIIVQEAIASERCEDFF